MGVDVAGLVDEAVEEFDELLNWLDLDKEERGRRYNWSPAEERELRKWWGKVSRPELVARINAVLQRVTGDPEAARSIDACNSQAQRMGLQAYDGEPNEMCLTDAAQLVELPYFQLVQEANRGTLKTVKKGKQRYVSERALAIWFAGYRDRQETIAEVLEVVDRYETVTKQEAMRMAGLSETHMKRLLSTGAITAWRVPDRQLSRGEWAVQKESVERYIQAKAEGRLAELLNQFPEYVKQRKGLNKQVRQLRRRGRVSQPDPLTRPRSTYHPGCFRVSQLASHVGMSTNGLYDAARRGDLTLEEVTAGGRPRYAVRPEEARRFAAWVKKRCPGPTRWSDRQRKKIAEAGLLTIKDLTRRWDKMDTQISDYHRRGLRGHKLVGRKWGCHWVFEVEDVEEFERLTGLEVFDGG